MMPTTADAGIHARHAALIRRAAGGDMQSMYQALRVEAAHIDWVEVEPLLSANGRPAGAELRFRLIPDSEMENMPRPAALLGDKLTVGGLSVLVGPPGCGKTFVALSMACSTATGVPMGEDDVHSRGPAVYVAAEGSAGLGARLRAWKTANHITGPLGVHFVTEPVSLLSAGDVQQFLDGIERLPASPALIVIDTLARCMVGADENSTQDMSAFIAGADRLRRVTGAHVQLLHHVNAGGERERGNTALRGACDTLMFLKSDGEDLTLSCEKQKDAPPFAKTHLRLSPIGDSCAVLTAKSGLQYGPAALTENQLETLALLQTHFLANGATTTEWLKASNVSERTFYNYRTLLVRGGYVVAPEVERGGRYTLSPLGGQTVTAHCK
jgi:hypothetical protein